MSDRPILVYVTCKNQEEAETILGALVKERLAACGNISGAQTSIYEWQGKIERSSEAVMIIKTVRSRFEDLRARVVDIHSYECPCILALDVVDGHAPFLSWITDQARPDSVTAWSQQTQ